MEVKRKDWVPLEKFLHELRQTVPHQFGIPYGEVLQIVERNRDHLGEFHALARRMAYGL